MKNTLILQWKVRNHLSIPKLEDWEWINDIFLHSVCYIYALIETDGRNQLPLNMLPVMYIIFVIVMLPIVFPQAISTPLSPQNIESQNFKVQSK